MRDGEDDEGRGRAVMPTPNSMVCILYFSHLPDVVGRGMPLLTAFLLFQHNEEGHIPLLVVLFLFRHGGEGHAPSPLCLCLIFDALGRGMPLLVAFLLFRHDEKGHIPLLVM